MHVKTIIRYPENTVFIYLLTIKIQHIQISLVFTPHRHIKHIFCATWLYTKSLQSVFVQFQNINNNNVH